MAGIWVFHGDGATFACAVFSSKKKAEQWIAQHHVDGVLTKMPLDISCYDWAVAHGCFTPKREDQRSGKFIQRFSSASLEHYHYRAGIREA